MSVVNKIVLSAVTAAVNAVRDRLPTTLASDRLKVDGSGVTQPVSDAGGSLTVDGAVTATQGTAAAANAPWYVRLSDGSSAIAVALDATLQDVRDRLPSSFGVGGGVKVDGSGTALPVSASALPLPTGASTETTLASVLAKLISAPATEAKQDTGNTSLSTLAGIVAAGKAAISAAQLPASLGQAARASSLSIAFSTEDAAKVPVLGQALAAGSSPVVLPSAQDVVAYAGSGGRVLTTEASASTIATNTTTLVGAVVAPDTTLPTNLVEIGGVGKDTAPTSVTDGRSVRAWFSRAGAIMADPIDRAARLLGALTGVNGTGVATGANPVPMQLSSGSALYTGASAATSLPIVFARSLSTVSATLAINGDVIKASAGVALWITITNTTGSSVYWQIFDLASGPPANGARAAASAPAITANNGSRAGDLIGPTLGLGCNTGILLVLSLSPTTYSAVASNSCSYSIQYI